MKQKNLRYMEKKMPKIEVNGKTVYYNVSPYNARLTITSYKRKILESFKKIGIEPPYLDIIFGGGMGYTSSDGWAKVTWIVNSKEHEYKCDSQPREVDNVAAIAQIIESDCKAIRRGLKTFGQVMNQFAIGYNTETEKIKSNRDILGVNQDCKDLDYISYKYKQKSKELHPDNGGDEEGFKELNEAYTELQKELGN